MPCEQGHIIGDDIECPWHRSCFNIKTGRVTRDSAMKDVATYEVRLAGDEVEVEVLESRGCVVNGLPHTLTPPGLLHR